MSRKGCSDITLKDCATNTYKRVDKPALSDEDSKKLAEMLIEMVSKNAIDRKRVTFNYEVTMMYRGFASSDNFVVSDEFGLMFFNMYSALCFAINNTYSSGISRGKSALIGLNDGTLSMSDFNTIN